MQGVLLTSGFPRGDGFFQPNPAEFDPPPPHHDDQPFGYRFREDIMKGEPLVIEGLHTMRYSRELQRVTWPNGIPVAKGTTAMGPTQVQTMDMCGGWRWDKIGDAKPD